MGERASNPMDDFYVPVHEYAYQMRKYIIHIMFHIYDIFPAILSPPSGLRHSDKLPHARALLSSQDNEAERSKDRKFLIDQCSMH